MRRGRTIGLRGFSEAGGPLLRALWDRYLAVRGEVRPADYEVCYPQALLDSLARRGVEGCRTIGLRGFSEAGDPGMDIPSLLREAWERFIRAAESYPDWEQARLAELWAELGLAQP